MNRQLYCECTKTRLLTLLLELLFHFLDPALSGSFDFSGQTEQTPSFHRATLLVMCLVLFGKSTRSNFQMAVTFLKQSSRPALHLGKRMTFYQLFIAGSIQNSSFLWPYWFLLLLPVGQVQHKLLLLGLLWMLPATNTCLPALPFTSRTCYSYCFPASTWRFTLQSLSCLIIFSCRSLQWFQWVQEKSRERIWREIDQSSVFPFSSRPGICQSGCFWIQLSWFSMIFYRHVPK